jgi:hypothetical protein
MKRASAACAGSVVCQSVTNLAVRTARRSDAGAITKPSRRVGSMVLENEPI